MHRKKLRRWPKFISLISTVTAFIAVSVAPQVFAATAAPAPVCINNICTVTFPFKADYYTWTAPASITNLRFDLYGGQGGGAMGGKGGQVSGTFSSVPTSLVFYVGGAGTTGDWAAGAYNGGGDGGYGSNNAGTGGGRTEMRTDVRQTTFASQQAAMVVAGGGGGQSGFNGTATAVAGGAGGMLTGTNGANGSGGAGGGGGATQTAAGTGGLAILGNRPNDNGYSGYYMQGAGGGDGTKAGGGGGGGGYWGGGSGAAYSIPDGSAGAGGGGSSFVAANFAGTTTNATGVRSGAGLAVLTYDLVVAAAATPTPTPTPTEKATPTPNATSLATPTATASPAPTATVSASPSPTPTASVTPTPTPTAVAPPDPSPTATSFPTPDPSETPTTSVRVETTAPTPPAPSSPSAPPEQTTPIPSASNPEPSNGPANSPLEELLLPVIAPIVEPIVEPVFGSIADIFEDVGEALMAGPQLPQVKSRAASLGLIPTSEIAISSEAESPIVDSELSQNLMNDPGKDQPKKLAIESTTGQSDWQAFVGSEQLAWVSSVAGTIGAGLAAWFAVTKLRPNLTLRLRRPGRLARLS